MHPFDFADLRAVEALAEARHFARAAATLGISQPALTKRIQQLELRLGGALFHRSRAGVALTPAGEQMVLESRRILHASTRAVEVVRDHISGQAGSLRVGAGLAVLLGKLPKALAAFQQRFPDVHVVLEDLPTQSQLARLNAGALDVIFPRLPVSQPGLNVETFSDEHLAWAVHRDHPRSLNRLFEAPFLVLERSVSPTFHDHVLATCHAAGHIPRRLREANQVLTILTMIDAGVGFSLLPASLRRLRLPNVRFRSVANPVAAWPIGMVWPKDRHSPLLKQLLPYLRAQ